MNDIYYPQRTAKGKQLEALARILGVERKTWFWIFRESDKSLRARAQEVAQGPRRKQSPLGGAP
jgi:hypothetical protein